MCAAENVAFRSDRVRLPTEWQRCMPSEEMNPQQLQKSRALLRTRKWLKYHLRRPVVGVWIVVDHTFPGRLRELKRDLKRWFASLTCEPTQVDAVCALKNHEAGGERGSLICEMRSELAEEAPVLP